MLFKDSTSDIIKKNLITWIFREYNEKLLIITRVDHICHATQKSLFFFMLFDSFPQIDYHHKITGIICQEPKRRRRNNMERPDLDNGLLLSWPLLRRTPALVIYSFLIDWDGILGLIEFSPSIHIQIMYNK